MYRYGLYLSALLLNCADASAHNIQELSLEQKVARASVVVIATATTDDYALDHSLNRFITVRVKTVLKGNPASSIVLNTRSSGMGASLDCCRVGHTYLFFLTPYGDKKNVYESVNWVYGFYPFPDG